MFWKVLQTWDCFTRISILQTIKNQYARSQRQFIEDDRLKQLYANHLIYRRLIPITAFSKLLK